MGTSFALASVDASASPSARLIYVRSAETESCPDQNAVRAAVSARLGYDPFFPSARETIVIEISKEKGGFRARIKLVDDDNYVRGTREIAEKGRSCSAMIDTLALSISIAIDPDSLTRLAAEPPTEKEPAGPRESVPPLASGAPVAAPLPPAPPPLGAPDELPPSMPARNPSSRVELLVLPAAWVGTGPSVAFGGELGARLKWPRVSVGLEARGDVPASRSVNGIDVEMAFLGGSLVGCGHSSVFFACGRGTLGSISATSDATLPRHAKAIRFLLGANVGAEVPAGPALRLVARLTGNVAVDRQTIVINDADAFELSRFSGALEVGVLVRF